MRPRTADDDADHDLCMAILAVGAVRRGNRWFRRRTRAESIPETVVEDLDITTPIVVVT